MDFLASALTSIPAIAWGEIAMGYVGVSLVFSVSPILQFSCYND